jgi:hypothetical protein
VAKLRITKRTALLVGEGDREYAFAQHLRRAYASHAAEVSITTVNAQGRGASNTIETAIEVARATPYDAAVSMADAGGDLTNGVRARARARKIVVVESTPCLEAWLLEVHGLEVETTHKANRRAFRNAFGGHLFDDGVLERSFDADRLNDARRRIGVLDRLLVALGIVSGGVAGAAAQSASASSSIRPVLNWEQTSLDI